MKQIMKRVPQKWVFYWGGKGIRLKGSKLEIEYQRTDNLIDPTVWISGNLYLFLSADCSWSNIVKYTFTVKYWSIGARINDGVILK